MVFTLTFSGAGFGVSLALNGLRELMREFEERSSSRAKVNAFRRVASAAGNEESSQRL